MDKKSILELKRRLKKDACTFTKMCGCYVDGNKNKVVRLNETFLNLEEDEFYKYLEIAKKALSGVIGNNLLELEFPKEEEQAGGHQQFLMGLKASALKNEELLDRFYDLVIDNYEYVGNYLILLFHDAYDVMVKTTDNQKMDESEEVYEYIICVICPVALTKPGLGYRKEDKRIGAMDRNWMVGMPETGFTFPAFSERSTDIHSVMFYTKDTKSPHEEIIGNVLGCQVKRTATQKQIAFTEIIEENIEENRKDEVIFAVHERLSEAAEGQQVQALSGNDLAKIMMETGIPESNVKQIETKYKETFMDELPAAENLVDTKMLKAYEARMARMELEAEVEQLKKQLGEVRPDKDEGSAQLMAEAQQLGLSENEIIVNVKGNKKEQIRSEYINGQKCLVIPVSEEDKVIIQEN